MPFPGQNVPAARKTGGVMVASNNVRQTDATVYTAAANAYMLVAKFVPPTTGEVKLTYDIKGAATNLTYNMYVYTNASVWRGFATGSSSARAAAPVTAGAIGAASGVAPFLDYRTTLGTVVTPNALSNAEPVLVPFDGLGSISDTIYHTRTCIMNVHEAEPVYLILIPQTVSGIVTNIAFSYDIM